MTTLQPRLHPPVRHLLPAVAALALAVIATAGAQPLSSAPWPMRGQNLRHAGGGKMLAPDNGVVVRKLHVGICSPPAIDAGGTLCVGCLDGKVSAVDANGVWRPA